MTGFLIKLFIKDSTNTQNTRVREAYGKFSGVVGIATNFFLFVVKIIAGTLFRSISITADAVNNLSDMGSSIVTLISFKISGKPADAEHPYGHARMEYISGQMVSFIVLVLGIQLMQQSVVKIIQPQAVMYSWLTIAILVVSVLVKIWQCLFYQKIGRIINSSAITAASVDSRNDVLATSSVLAAALVTLLSGINLDGYMGAAVAAFIIVSGVRLLMDTISSLLGTAPSEEMVRMIYKKILGYEGVVGLHDLHVHNYGVSRCFASVHCEVPAEQDIMMSHDIVDNIERDFLKDMGIHMVIHLDPVVVDNEKTNALKTAVGKLIREISPEIGIHDFRVVWGVTHSTLIFDIVVPYKFKLSDKALTDIIEEKISRIDPSYRTVITVDHAYVPNIAD
ncbi:MAG: cation diffusion facilitator family transporter [Bacillota bacterium]